ncbi:MAG: FliG C-terminal domain-containing protein [Candidatus Omnitrophota bacterium]
MAHLAGSDILAKILNVSSDEIIHTVIEKLQKDNPELAKETRDKLFLFEDIAALDSKILGVILNNLDKDTLKLSLKHAPPEVLTKIFSAMTERGAAILKEDLEIMAAVSKESSKEAQKSILEKIRELEKKGAISLKRG